MAATITILERNQRRQGVRKRGFSLEEGGALLVGRHEKAHVRVDDPNVSRKHLSLQLWKGRVYAEDLSKNGAMINGRKLEGRVELGDHDVVRLGETLLKVRSEPAEKRSLVGELLGAYRLVEVLGRGRTAKVFLARHEDGLAGNEPVVVKVLGEAGAGHNGAERFVRAAELARGIKHKNIVRALDSGRDAARGILWVVLERVDGESLGALLAEDEALPIGECLSVCRQVGGALSYLHARRIVHRHVKPGNVLVDREGVAHLAGLGLAKPVDDKDLTATGRALGDLRYSAPEQLLDAREVDHRADVYGLAAMAFRLLTGKLPVEVKGRHELFVRIADGPPARTASSVMPDIWPALDLALARALVFDPDRRTASVDAFLAEVDAATPAGALGP